MDYSRFQHTRITPKGEEKYQIPLSTAIILEQAELYGVQWRSLPGTTLIELNYQGKVKHFRYQISSETTDVGFHACLDKGVTQTLLKAAEVQVANGFKLSLEDSDEMYLEAFHKLHAPVVVKPSHGQQGKSVYVGISDEAAFLNAVQESKKFSSEEDAGVIIEEMFTGKEYRVTATREKVVAVLHRIPANVVGDGTKTVNQLVDEKNADPRRGRDLNYALFIIEKNQAMTDTLAEQNLTLESVPAAGQHVALRKVSNIMQGGDSIDLTDKVHPSVKEIAVKAMNAIPGLGFAGVDFMSKDIFAEQTPDNYIIIEINSSPGICIHEFPYEGQKRYTDREFLFVMYPELRQEEPHGT